MANVDPTKYVVAVDGGFAVLPFTEDVGLLLYPKYEGAVLSAKEVLEQVAGVDISLVADRGPWDVVWMKGSDLTAEALGGIR